MCFIVLAHRHHPRYPLVVAANRDERRDRPSERAAPWPAQPSLVAGRDRKQGGTWLGITHDGRFSAVTNYRHSVPAAGQRSRGHLVLDYLGGWHTAAQYAHELASRRQQYAGFNLLIGDRDELHYVSNHAPQPQVLAPGIYGLSNHLLNTPWPKLLRGVERFTALLREDEPQPESLFALLGDRSEAPATTDGDCPSQRRRLSPIYIKGGDYGTVNSTVVLLGHDGIVQFIERSWDTGGACTGEAAYRFRLNGHDGHHDGR